MKKRRRRRRKTKARKGWKVVTGLAYEIFRGFFVVVGILEIFIFQHKFRC
jgi:hypothetical protein